MNGLQVSHFSTFRNGGAGNAAQRLNASLRQLGVNSMFFALDARDQPAMGLGAIPKRYTRYYEHVLSRLGIRVTHELQNGRRLEILGIDGPVFSFPESDYDLLGLQPARDADILHLHWVAGLLDWGSFFSSCSKPVVWTLHDMNPFLGGVHYTSERALLGSAARSYDAVLQSRKNEAIRRFNRLIFVAPSKWMADEARASEILGRFRHVVIPDN